ncbi:MAG TPA: hybrid sensor histidine kinase/response regulator [Opitutaceae bacterium]|jgi:two-component system sensor histidine kinase/response regulator
MTVEAAPAKILVVDDQEANVKALSSMLGKQGYAITHTTKSDEVLAELSRSPADLILLDALMPGMDGFEVCRLIRGHPELAQTPIVFLSAADDKAFIVRALNAGAVDYVTKPFNQAELISRVRTHLALKQARDRLARLAEDKDELIGILAHDLKNHLGGMQMSAQLLHDRSVELSDNRLTRMSANILDASNQMYHFVKEFLANAAADRDEALKLEAVSISGAASSAVQRYAEAARRKSLSFHEDYPAENPLVAADQGALDQVIDNLVSNAVKFSPPERSIWLTISQLADKRVEFRIRDEGPGCDEHDLAHMFMRYQRLSARPTAGEPSTGLGLSIAKRHALAMGGELVCQSQPGHGATFILRLPVAS